MPDSPDSSSPNLPARAPLDRAALDRVLARAAELQAHEADPGDVMLTEEQLIEVAKEAGLSPQHVRQALAEERTRLVLPEDPGFAGRIAGPPVASATRTVRGTPAEVLAALDAWMQREECLQVKRRFADRMTWEARRDFLGGVQRALNIGGRGYALTRAPAGAATGVPGDEGRVLVRLDADLSGSRTSRLVGGGATAAAGPAARSTPPLAGSLLVAHPAGLFFLL